MPEIIFRIKELEKKLKENPNCEETRKDLDFWKGIQEYFLNGPY
jgi:hypothetical protein